jgi:hypothetical protein
MSHQNKNSFVVRNVHGTRPCHTLDQAPIFFGENIETIGFISLENHSQNAFEGTSKK